jgi:hypothetical protein
MVELLDGDDELDDLVVVLEDDEVDLLLLLHAAASSAMAPAAAATRKTWARFVGRLILLFPLVVVSVDLAVRVSL